MFPVFEAMAMGWTWALHFCNEAVAVLADQLPDSGEAGAQHIREKCVAPRLAPSRPVVAIYVDNYTGIGGTRADAQASLDSFKATAEDGNIGVHGDAVVSQVFDSLGVDFDLVRRTLRHKPRRVWRVVLAGRALARTKRRTRGIGEELCSAMEHRERWGFSEVVADL